MRIGLIDVDYNGSFPNLPLMKISAYHKAQGNSVEWYAPFDDRYVCYDLRQRALRTKIQRLAEVG